MIDKYNYELSKLYSRLMRLELSMKRRARSAILSYYGDNALNVFKKFFLNKDRLKRYKKGKGNIISDILRNNKDDDKSKLIKLVDVIYLSDMLCLVLHCEQFFKKEITQKFYKNVPDKFGILIRNKKFLVDLRNDVAHYNLYRYSINKRRYWDTLSLFEFSFGENIDGIKELPYFDDRKPCVKEVLDAIAELRPDLLDLKPKEEHQMEYDYNKHKLLIDLFDEIALYNGYEMNELPSPWTVLRQMYRAKSDYKENISSDTLADTSSEVIQTSFKLEPSYE